MTATIVMEGLVKQYPNGVRGVDGVDLSIAEGEFFALLGPSGCGKTTLLRSIAGLESITEGTLHIGGVDMTGAEPGQRGMAMVFQDYALFPHMDVSDNIAYPLRIRRVAKTQRRRAAADTASRLSLAELLERKPGQLSGGQQQRAALARAITTKPDVLLLDEPLSNLDARLRLEATSSRICSAASASPRSSSPTTRRRPSRSPTASPSCGTAGSSRSALPGRSSTGPPTSSSPPSSGRTR